MTGSTRESAVSNQPEALAVTCYNVVYPDISPTGTSIVVLTALKYGEPWYAIPPEQYVDTKNRIADAMITLAEKVFPGLREYTEVVEVSTPLTNMRYAGAMGGSIYGFNQPPRDNMVWRMGHRGRWKGCILSARGLSPAAVSNLA